MSYSPPTAHEVRMMKMWQEHAPKDEVESAVEIMMSGLLLGLAFLLFAIIVKVI